jgi:tetratricopeptide (TPR) repeat protein
MKKTKITAALLFSLALILVLTHFTQAQSSTPQETLQQYIADLQRNPNNIALREKIIKLVLEMIPAPAIPEEAEKAFVKGAMFLEKAKDSTALELSISSFKQALLIAPWWPDAYYNLGIVLESAGRYDESIQNIKYYLLTNPSETDAKKAQRKIVEIEAEKELAQAEETAKKRAEEEKKAKEPHFEGTWEQQWANGKEQFKISRDSFGNYTGTKQSTYGSTPDDIFVLVNISVNGRNIRFTQIEWAYDNNRNRQEWEVEFDLILSDDGETLYGKWVNHRLNGKVDVSQRTYQRK